MRILFLSLIVAVSSLPGLAIATVEIDPKTGCDKLWAGKGAWLDPTALSRCLGCDINLEIAKEEIVLLKEDKNSFKKQLEYLKLSKEARLTQISDLKILQQSLDDELNKWYRRPIFVVSIGVMVGIITTTMVVSR